jgi:hypothetical protein
LSQKSQPPHWRCQTCKLPITRQQAGLLTSYNANPDLGQVGAYPIDASPDEPPDVASDAAKVARDLDVATMAEQQRFQVQDAIWMLERPINVDFAAFHGECDPNPKYHPYQIPLPLSPDRFLAWVIHLGEKSWLGGWDTRRLLRFYWSHKGEQPPPPL